MSRSAGPGGMAYAVAHAVALVLLAIAGLINAVLGVVLLGLSVPLALGFLAVSGVLFWGLWKASRVAVAVGTAGLVLGPVVAEAVGAQVEGYSHVTTLLGAGLLLAVWLLTYAHRPQARRAGR